jgi:hypothetical protein
MIMTFVTWENVGVDRIACAWLIRKYVDKNAKFLFVAEGSTTFPAGAEPFDIPGVKLSHHHGHCSFHALLREYKLMNDPILKRIARIIDEADTVQEASLEQAASGLDVICSGMRLISPSDEAALERGAAVYDALYAALKQEGV